MFARARGWSISHSIEKKAAAAFHASTLLPLARINAREGVRYFATGPDASRESYWERPVSRTGGVAELAAGCDADALLADLARHWAARGDKRLGSLGADMLALRAKMLAEPAVADDGEVSISVYPLF